MSPAPLPLPFIRVPGVSNFRSVTVPGLRPQLLFRSAQLSQLSSAGAGVFQELGIAAIYDLRTNHEFKLDTELDRAIEGHGIRRFSVPVYSEETCPPKILEELAVISHASTRETRTRSHGIYLMYAPKAYRQVLKHLATEDTPAPLVVHCRGGEGRTGLLIAIILALYGVPRDLIALEYSLTHAPLSGIGTENAKRVPGPLGWDRDLEAKAKSLSFIHESIDIVFEILDTTYGGVTGYVKNHCGLSDEEIEMIRKNLAMN